MSTGYSTLLSWRIGFGVGSELGLCIASDLVGGGGTEFGTVISYIEYITGPWIWLKYTYSFAADAFGTQSSALATQSSASLFSEAIDEALGF